MRNVNKWQGFSRSALPVTILCVLTLAVTACSRLALPGPEPTAAQPVAVATTAQQFSPTLTLDPPSGHAGIYVQVSGAGWPPHMMVVVVLTDPSGISTTVASKDTDNSGQLVTGFLYPIDARWLIEGPYTVTAESADGKYRASAAFTVVQPGAEITPDVADTPAVEITPTAIATNIVAAAPTVTPVPTLGPTVVPTAVPTTAPTPVPTATDPAPTPVPQPTATAIQAPTAEAAPASDNGPLVTVALVPGKDRPGASQQYRVEIQPSEPDGTLRQLTAVLAIPPLHQVSDVKLKTRNKVEIKVERSKLEISAPDPEALLAAIQQQGGIEVESGQVVEYRSAPEHSFRLTFEDGKMQIRASTLLLQVTAVDADGVSHHITASLPADDDKDEPKRNRGRGNKEDDRGRDNRDDRRGDDDRNDDDRDDDPKRPRSRDNDRDDDD